MEQLRGVGFHQASLIGDLILRSLQEERDKDRFGSPTKKCRRHDPDVVRNVNRILETNEINKGGSSNGRKGYKAPGQVGGKAAPRRPGGGESPPPQAPPHWQRLEVDLLVCASSRVTDLTRSSSEDDEEDPLNTPEVITISSDEECDGEEEGAGGGGEDGESTTPRQPFDVDLVSDNETDSSSSSSDDSVVFVGEVVNLVEPDDYMDVDYEDDEDAGDLEYDIMDDWGPVDGAATFPTPTREPIDHPPDLRGVHPFDQRCIRYPGVMREELSRNDPPLRERFNHLSHPGEGLMDFLFLDRFLYRLRERVWDANFANPLHDPELQAQCIRR